MPSRPFCDPKVGEKECRTSELVAGVFSTASNTNFELLLSKNMIVLLIKVGCTFEESDWYWEESL